MRRWMALVSAVLCALPAWCGAASISLEWDPPAAYRPTQYRVYVSVAPMDTDAAACLDLPGWCTGCVVDRLDAGEVYYLAVAAVADDGTESVLSNQVCTTAAYCRLLTQEMLFFNSLSPVPLCVVSNRYGMGLGRLSMPQANLFTAAYWFLADEQAVWTMAGYGNVFYDPIIFGYLSSPDTMTSPFIALRWSDPV